MPVRVEINRQVIEGDPQTLEITAYQRRFYSVVTSELRSLERTFVPDPYVSLEDVNSDPDVHHEFEHALWRQESAGDVCSILEKPEHNNNLLPQREVLPLFA